MAAGPLFLGLLILAWLYLGLAGWLVATVRFRPRASFLALAAALVASSVAGALPALFGWRTLAGLIAGLLLAAICSTAAAWQTMSRARRGSRREPDARHCDKGTPD